VFRFFSKLLPSYPSANDTHLKLRWLMFARVVFACLLLGAALLLQIQSANPVLMPLVASLYLLIGFIFVLSLLYGTTFRQIKRQKLFAYLQIAIDTTIVTAVVLITGGFHSLFSFLYLVVIIYASMILYMRGGFFVACLISLEYTLILSVVSVDFSISANLAGVISHFSLYEPSAFEIVYKVLTTSMACIAVAVLSGLLTEQNRKTQDELRVMSTHVKRVEKMAYMGEMAAGLAHEIKNPLASLVGSIQLLKDDLSCDPDHGRLMEIVLRETDRLSTLVNEFLFFARPPAGRPELLDLKETIEEVTGLFERDPHHAMRFSVTKRLDSDVRVIMDPAHLRQVLWNLLLNAAESVQDDGTIEIHAVAIKNNEVRIHVKDNGCGIPADVVPKIFDPFFTTKPEGTGLGLSIVHRILEAYDSRLDVQSQVGCGATFSFVLKRSGMAN
jgi:two-component system sensor histidine kinase PilS (NtrC family)